MQEQMLYAWYPSLDLSHVPTEDVLSLHMFI